MWKTAKISAIPRSTSRIVIRIRPFERYNILVITTVAIARAAITFVMLRPILILLADAF